MFITIKSWSARSGAGLALAAAIVLFASGLAFAAPPLDLNRVAGCGIHTCTPNETKFGQCVDRVSSMTYKCAGSKRWSIIQDGCDRSIGSLQEEVVRRCSKSGISSKFVPLQRIENIGEVQKGDECTVRFPDQNLHNAVCGLFEMGEECEISCDDPRFLSTTRIRFSEMGIQNLRGIERFENLTFLALDYNQIVDITPVADLVELEVFFLNNNQIVDIAPLANLVNLHTLVFSHNQVNDITPVAGLVNLHTLAFPHSQVVDITPVSG